MAVPRIRQPDGATGVSFQTLDRYQRRTIELGAAIGRLFIAGVSTRKLALIELKNPTDEDATIWKAYQQIQTYKAELPTLFAYNVVLVITDGVEARIGTLTAGREWFKPWRTIRGESLASPSTPELQVMLEGVFDKRRVLDLIAHLAVFEDDGGRLEKKVAGYHQFHAVNVAVRETVRAARLRDAPGVSRASESGDRRIGVVWHTQGSGKSLSMAFYAGRVIRDPEMENPTIVVLTDRNDLDDQLFGTFSRCQDLLRQPPVQAADRADLRKKLSVQAGGVVFTTIQKFFPEEKGDKHPALSDRRNIVVIADDAHRSQYDFIDGFARHMRDALPNASFIGFTGTPIEVVDKNTRAVFGEYISVYDIQRSVEDKATVPIYYESRLAKLELDEGERPRVDPDFEEVTEGEEIERKEKLKTKWAQIEAIVGSEKRLKLVARDIVYHFDRRLEPMDGKAMVVCMSRRICVELHREIVALRPHWQADTDDQGGIKVVMTGSASDPTDWQQHIRNKPRREALANRFRDHDDPLRMVLVRDMWLTGLDAPSLHTMYVDKPMRGHGLMQAIARVNRVFGDKPGGLVVDHLGLSHELKLALATYTENGGTGTAAIDLETPCWQCVRSTRSAARCSAASVRRRGPRAIRPSDSASCRPPRNTAWSRRTARTDSSARCGSYRRPLHWPCRMRRPCEFAMTWRSSRPCAPAWPSARPVRRGLTRNWTSRSVRSSPGRWLQKELLTSSRPPAWRSPTSRSCQTISWPRCATCRSATLPLSYCASCSAARSAPGVART